MEAIINKMKATCRTLSTENLLVAIRQVHQQNSQEARMARACLLDVYEERTSGEALDSLMDELGL